MERDITNPLCSDADGALYRKDRTRASAVLGMLSVVEEARGTLGSGSAVSGELSSVMHEKVHQ